MAAKFAAPIPRSVRRAAEPPTPAPPPATSANPRAGARIRVPGRRRAALPRTTSRISAGVRTFTTTRIKLASASGVSQSALRSATPIATRQKTGRTAVRTVKSSFTGAVAGRRPGACSPADRRRARSPEPAWQIPSPQVPSKWSTNSSNSECWIFRSQRTDGARLPLRSSCSQASTNAEGVKRTRQRQTPGQLRLPDATGKSRTLRPREDRPDACRPAETSTLHSSSQAPFGEG